MTNKIYNTALVSEARQKKILWFLSFDLLLFLAKYSSKENFQERWPGDLLHETL